MFWRMGAMASAFPHLPTLYIVHFSATYSTRLPKKGWRCRDDVDDDDDDDERGVSGQKQKQRQQVSGLVYLSRHNGFHELATQQF